MDDAHLHSAFIRSQQSLHAHLSIPESLGIGSAYCAPSLPRVRDANQVCDVLLGGVDPAEAFDRVESHFAARATRCLRWTLSPDQSPAPVERHLTALGWAAAPCALLGTDHLPADLLRQPAPESAPHGIRILPARAMRRAFAATFIDAPAALETAEPAGQRADAAVQRLDDSNYDVFVATLDGRPAGRAALMLAGDIGRVHDLFVLPGLRGRGIARALLRHVFQLAYRLRPRVVVADVPGNESTESAAARHLLTAFGLRGFGTLHQWNRPGP